MPFDGSQVNIYALRRAQLIDALRREMPENFEWDFCQFLGATKCGYAGCAIGLMRIEFPDFDLQINLGRVYSRAAKFLGISPLTARKCFSYSGWNRKEPSAKQVADKLEKLTKDLPAI